MRKGGLEVGPLVERAAMGERFDSELGAREGVPQLAVQRRQVDVAGGPARRPLGGLQGVLQWIAMKKRLKRMA
ncbi:hypothetical protein D3C83_142720 [compost metagenome]